MAKLDKDRRERIERLLRDAFWLGHCVTREGFNGECAYDNCAPWPEDIDPHHLLQSRFDPPMPAYDALEDKAVQALLNNAPSDEGGEEADRD